MSKNRYLTRVERKHIRNWLLQVRGNQCYWCGQEMEIPVHKKPVKDVDNMATIEHYFAKLFNDIDNIKLLCLSHKKCNK